MTFGIITIIMCYYDHYILLLLLFLFLLQYYIMTTIISITPILMINALSMTYSNNTFPLRNPWGMMVEGFHRPPDAPDGSLPQGTLQRLSGDGWQAETLKGHPVGTIIGGNPLRIGLDLGPHTEKHWIWAPKFG